MGIDGGHKLKRQADSGDGLSRLPSIYFDASWISQKFKGRQGGPVTAILDIVTCFAKEGLFVVAVCDGARRHDSKRASVNRQSNREKNRIMAHAMRDKIICKKAALRTASGTASETKLQQEMDKLLAVLKKKEKEQEDFVLIGQDFYNDLKEMVSKNVCCDKIHVLQSMFQADTTIACTCIQKKCDIEFMCDMDLAAYAGKSCLGIEDF
jgi:hypothetical protein